MFENRVTEYGTVEITKPRIPRGLLRFNDLQLDKTGLAYRGLLVRHLVLPNRLAGTEKVLKFIAHEISTGTYLNLMDHYYPCYRASEILELSRPISTAEYQEALAIARHLGLTRLSV